MSEPYDIENIISNHGTDYKYCKRCEKVKNISKFYLRKDGYYEPRCKSCDSIRNKTPERKLQNKNVHLKRRYGITLKEQQILIEKQNGKCGICDKNLSEIKNIFIHTDHDHKTKDVRGVLCFRCNRLLGWYEKNKNNIIRYLPYNPFTPVRDFEIRIAKYCNSKYAVCIDSCTNALYLTLIWHRYKNPEIKEVVMPKRSYVGVPIHIIRAGFNVKFRDENWKGIYKLEPFDVYDAARRFTSNMYIPNSFMCVSFHYSKILKLSQAGAILHDNDEFDMWCRKMRFDGRTEDVAASKDNVDMLGLHCYIGSEIAGEGLIKLHHLKNHNDDLPNDNYPDLSKLKIFK